MPYTVREKYLWELIANGKGAGLARHMGQPIFVLPGTSATHFSYVSNQRKWVETDLDSAINECSASRGDYIVLCPGTHTVSTTSAALDLAGVTIMGPEAFAGLDRPHMASMAILTTDITGDEIINVTAAYCTLRGVTIRPITAGVGLDLTADADYFNMVNCYFDLFTPAVSTSTVGLKLAAATGIVVDGCAALSDGAQGNAIVATAALDSEIRRFLATSNAGTWASVILCGAATKNLLIDEARIYSSGTAITVGVNGTGATIASGVFVNRSWFGQLVTVPIDNFDAGECEINECYKADVGGGAGGTKITAIT